MAVTVASFENLDATEATITTDTGAYGRVLMALLTLGKSASIGFFVVTDADGSSIIPLTIGPTDGQTWKTDDINGPIATGPVTFGVVGGSGTYSVHLYLEREK